MAYSICKQYSHAAVNLILMAVGQKDIEHWKEPEAYCPINNYDSKLHLSIKHMNFMHNNFNTCMIQCSSHCDLLEHLQYMQKHMHI